MLMPLLEMYRRGKLLEQKTSGICSLEREFQTCVREGVLEARRSRRINVESVNLVGIRSCMVRQAVWPALRVLKGGRAMKMGAQRSANGATLANFKSCRDRRPASNAPEGTLRKQVGPGAVLSAVQVAFPMCKVRKYAENAWKGSFSMQAEERHVTG